MMLPAAEAEAAFIVDKNKAWKDFVCSQPALWDELQRLARSSTPSSIAKRRDKSLPSFYWETTAQLVDRFNRTPPTNNGGIYSKRGSRALALLVPNYMDEAAKIPVNPQKPSPQKRRVIYPGALF